VDAYVVEDADDYEILWPGSYGSRRRVERVAVELWTETVSADADALELALYALTGVFAEVLVLIAAADDDAVAEVPFRRRDGTIDRSWINCVEATAPLADVDWVDGRLFDGDVPDAQVQAFLGAHRSTRTTFTTASVDSGRVRVGPEEAAIDAVIRGARELEKSRRRKAQLERRVERSTPRWTRWYALPMVSSLLMVFAWLVPIDWATVTGFGASLTIVMALTVIAFRRSRFSLVVVGAAIAVFVLGMFGEAFAVDSLVERAPLGDASHLGFAYLISTGIAVGAGLVTSGGLGGFAKVIAHIELLIFATFIGGAVAAASAAFLRTDGRIDDLGRSLREGSGS